jgi:cytochrome d ubiquinol oxidase subunit I
MFSMAMGMITVVAPIQILAGDQHGLNTLEHQPAKVMAMEGLQQTQEGAPFTLGGFYDASRGEVRFGIEVPKLLSLLAKHDPNARIVGLDSVPPDDRPPVNIVRYGFQTMAAIGTFLALLGVVFIWTWYRKRRLPASPWFFRAVMIAGPLSFVALIAGWVTTEVGRQPWIVYEIMRTEQAVTAAGGLAVGYVVLVAVYLALAVAVAWLLRRLARKPPESEVAGDAA